MTRRHVMITIAAVALIAGSTLVLAGPGGPGTPGVRGGGRGGHGGFGQGPGDGGRLQGMRGPLGPLGRALHRLDLSDEQQAQVRSLVEAARPEMHALRTQLRESRQAFREAHPPTDFDEAAIRNQVAAQSAVMADLAVLGAKLRADVLKVLTPDQLAELEAMRAKRGEWRTMKREFWDEGS